MIGNNELHLCAAQMAFIVQEWVDRNIGSMPRVRQVEYKSSGLNPSTFVVSLDNKPRGAAEVTIRVDPPDHTVDRYATLDPNRPPGFDPRTGL